MTGKVPPRGRGSVDVSAGPDVQVLGGRAAVIQGAAALDAYRLLSEGIALVRRRDGIEPSARLLSTVGALKLAALASSDTPDIADVRDSTESAWLRSGEVLGLREVARMLQVGERQARRLAPAIGGTKTTRGWRFDSGLVRSYLALESRRSSS